MLTKARIALSIPDADNSGRYFSFRLHSALYNEPVIYNTQDSIFVVSDIEGNFQALCKLLIKHKVIDKYFNWIFDEGHLVVLGDCFDRGEQVVECLWLIYSLEEKAKKKGGYVHFILGNHEIMNMNGDWRYVHPKYAFSTRNSQKPPTALYDANNELWRWLHTKNIIEKIGNILFVHGGISTEMNEVFVNMEDINNCIRPFYSRAREPLLNPLLQILFSSEQSPFWYRGYYHGTASESQVNKTLEKFEVTTIITGHTIVENINIFFGGKIINVNTDHANGNSQGLLIRKGKFYRADRQGKLERLK